MSHRVPILVSSLLVLASVSLPVYAAPVHPAKVTLTGSALGEFHFDNCPLLTVFLANSFPHPQNVFVDIELRNASSTLVEQESFDNYTVASKKDAGITALTNACSAKLPDGRYTYSVGIFAPGGNDLVHWYPNVASFMVAIHS